MRRRELQCSRQNQNFSKSPACLRIPLAGFLSQIDDPGDVVGNKATGTLQNSAVDNDSIDVRRIAILPLLGS